MLKQMIALTALMVSSIAFAQDREYVIVVHGGAGAMAGLEEDPVKSAQYYAALDSALMIGDKVLSAGGEGPEAVMAVINYFEGNPLFNAGIGATCTVEGTFELDASSWLKTREASDQCRLCRKDKISACHAERSRC